MLLSPVPTSQPTHCLGRPPWLRAAEICQRLSPSLPSACRQVPQNRGQSPTDPTSPGPDSLRVPPSTSITGVRLPVVTQLPGWTPPLGTGPSQCLPGAILGFTAGTQLPGLPHRCSKTSAPCPLVISPQTMAVFFLGSASSHPRRPARRSAAPLLGALQTNASLLPQIQNVVLAPPSGGPVHAPIHVVEGSVFPAN